VPHQFILFLQVGLARRLSDHGTAGLQGVIVHANSGSYSSCREAPSADALLEHAPDTSTLGNCPCLGNSSCPTVCRGVDHAPHPTAS
jgi:hypothetical protein